MPPKLKKMPKPRDCCSEGDLIAAVADRVGVAAGGRQYKYLVSKKRNKKEKSQPCMGMASIIIDGVGDVATIIIIGVIMARVVVVGVSYCF